MLVSAIIDSVQEFLVDQGVYRTDAFVLGLLNDGYKLLSVVTLFDERKAETDIDGTRYISALPTDGDAECFAVLYAANTSTGNRINPGHLEDFELYSNGWEGSTADDSVYYIVLSPYHHPHSMFFACPTASVAGTSVSYIGAFIPADLGQSDEPRFQREFHDILFHYTVSMCFIAEPGRGGDRAAEHYKKFIDKANSLAASLKARFPSGMIYEPQSIEFHYDRVSHQSIEVDK